MYHRIYIYHPLLGGTAPSPWRARCGAGDFQTDPLDSYELARQAAEQHEWSVHLLGEAAAVIG